MIRVSGGYWGQSIAGSIVMICLFVFGFVFGFGGHAQAQPAEQPSVAMIGLDALGMDAERVLRLETLFLKELEQLTGKTVPNRRAVQKLKRRLRNCDGNSRCLAAIGRALRVDYVVAGNVASLGDSYILNVKAVASKNGTELRRIESDPLRGQPDELIDAVRVAAYRLLSPKDLVGSITLLVDRAGATVELDSKVIGKTPLSAPIVGLPLGEHKLRVSAGEFGEFSTKVHVRFQKATRVVVNLVDLRVKADPNTGSLTQSSTGPMVKRWYQKKSFLIPVGIGAALLGGLAGMYLADVPIIKCPGEDDQCLPILSSP